VALFCALLVGGSARSGSGGSAAGTGATVPLSISVREAALQDGTAGDAPLSATPALGRIPVPAPPLPDPAPRLRVADADPAPPRTIRAVVTAYCPCRRCCGRFADGRTSTGTTAWRPGIAADPSVLPYGTVLEVPGYGIATVDDTGGAMRRHWSRDGIIHIDVRTTYHWQARQWGRRNMEIRVLPQPE
jgi:3D (Asp-Asp-Asp) domain-containing protein